MNQAVAALIPIVAVAVLLVWALGASTSPSVVVDGDKLVIRFSSRDAVLGMRREFRIPLTSVKGIAVAPTSAIPRTGFRMPGAAIPRVLRAGSYGLAPHRDFWMLRRAQMVLVVELQPGEPYRRIVLEVPDPQGLAHELRPKIATYTGTFA